MKKNVIWWPALQNSEHSDKYGGFEYFEYSKKTWEYWCVNNDVTGGEMRPNNIAVQFMIKY